MKKLKRLLFRLGFAIEIIIVAVFYIQGNHGFNSVKQLKQELSIINEQRSALLNQIHGIEREIAAWQNCSFYKEKAAREQLQMARIDETIYYILDH